MDEMASSDARRRLLHLMSYLSEAVDVTDIDGTGEAAYAALYSMGLDEAPASHIGSILKNHGEASAIEEFTVQLDEALNVIGNCETETNNMKAAAWVRVRETAQTAYNILNIRAVA
jgi:hypothetical protein